MTQPRLPLPAAPSAKPAPVKAVTDADRQAAAPANDAEAQARYRARRLRKQQKKLTEKAKAQAVPPPMMPPAQSVKVQRRHWGIMASFVAIVALPMLVSAWYLWTRAADRYASYAGFSVRTEEVGSAIDLLSGVSGFSGSSSSDTDILYNFIQSQEMVAKVDAELDLRAIWSRPGTVWLSPDDDPVYAYHPPGTIEDLTEYWARMVKVYNDSGTGLIDLEVQAFTAEDATNIAQMIYDESSLMINRLSAIARDDATAYARDELDQAVERLKVARAALTQFRNRTQIVDPAASIQSQMGILSSLQTQLAETLVDLDILRQTAAETDPRIVQAQRRVEVIEARMGEERRKMGIGADRPGLILPSDPDAATPQASGSEATPQNPFANLMGEYERLAVDLDFAEQSYTAALAAFDAAFAEARRKTRYLAAHIQPTQAEAAEFPQRLTVLGLVALFAFLSWAILTLVAYSLKDRR